MQSKRILVMLATLASALVVIAVVMRGNSVLPGGDGAGARSAGSTGAGSSSASRSDPDALIDLAPLAERIDALQVESFEGTVRLERRDGTWVIASRDGFPAQTESVVGALRGLARLRKSQKLTAKPERHGDLGLAWPDSSNEAKLVSVYAGGETPVAQVVVGRSVYQPDGVYARLLSEPQTWRCAGSLNVAATPQTWLANPVADVTADSIQSISGCDTTGRTITLTRDDKGGWALAPAAGAGGDAAGGAGVDASAGAGAPTDSVAEGFKAAIPSFVVGMQAEEVRRATPEDATRPNTVTVTYGIGENAAVHARLWRDGETYFVMLDAALPEPAAAPAADAASPPAAPTADGAVEKSSDESSTKAPEDPFASVRKQSATWDGWVFTVPSWRANQLGRLFGDPAPAAPSSPMMTMPGGSAPPLLMPSPAPNP